MRRKKIGQILAAITMLFIIGNNINHKMCKVNGISMEPTLEDGDMIRMKRYSGSIKHGDVVAILSKDNHQYLIKRVIAYEGDELTIKNGIVAVNGKVIVRSHDIKHAIELKIPKGKVFVMGDNYKKSYDSREIGCLNMKDIIAYKDIPQKDARK